MKNMREYTTDSQERQQELQEQVQEGEQIASEIERVKEGTEGMPEGLDDDVAAEIQSAREAAIQRSGEPFPSWKPAQNWGIRLRRKCRKLQMRQRLN